MPGTLFHLVRHGAHDLLGKRLVGRGAVSINSAGEAEASAVAAALASARPAAIVSSPQTRTIETATIIAGACGLSVGLDAAFDEIDMGEWTGAEFGTLAADPRWRAFNRFRGTAPVPGGETMLAVQGRAVAGLLRLRRGYAERCVVIVSHADTLKAILMHCLGMPLDMMHRLDLPPGSTSIVELYDEDAVVRAVAVPPRR